MWLTLGHEKPGSMKMKGGRLIYQEVGVQNEFAACVAEAVQICLIKQKSMIMPPLKFDYDEVIAFVYV